VDDVAVDECCCDVFVTFCEVFYRYEKSIETSRQKIRVLERRERFNKNMSEPPSVLFKVFTLEQRDVFAKHVLPKLGTRERDRLRQVHRESRVAMQTVLSAKDYFGLAFPFHVPTHINEIIQASRDLEMVRYAHEHLHYKFSKGTANVAANIANKLAANVVVDDYGILKYVVDNGAPVELKTLHILNRPLFDEKIESIALKRENVFIRDHHMCTYCGRRYASDDLTIDHIVPASKGGEWSWTNLTAACAKCNNRKGAPLD